MRKSGIKKVLTAFGKDVISQAKKNLRTSKISTKGDLAKGMKSKTKVSPDSVNLEISIAEYWEFVDYGVEGVGGERKYKKGVKLKKAEPWVKKKVTNNKFKYKKKQPPASAFSRYTSDRGGQFAIAKSIFHTGLKTTSFFSEPFEREFVQLEADILEATTKAVEESLMRSFNNNDNITVQ
jgi:hypothetical protein